MKKRNIAAAILLASMMAVSTCAVTSMTASAGSIAVTSTATGTHTYTAYQLLTGTVSGDSLGQVAWGSALTSGLTSDMVSALTTNTTIGSRFSGITTATTAQQFAEKLGTLSGDTEKQEFARVIGSYCTTGGTAVSTDSASPTSVADGYYIVKDVASIPAGQTRTLNLLKVAGDNVTIATKENVPTSDKTVDDKNDSNGNTSLNARGQKSADYDIGDSIPYTLTFTLPENYNMYTTYPVTFIDDMCAGLTYGNDATIHYGSGDTTGTALSTNFAQDTGATSSYTNGTVYKYVISDLKIAAPSLSAGDEITITYHATLNSNATIGGSGNENTYTVQFANDPNITATGTPTTSTTPEKKSVVFTYQLVVDKVDENNNPLPNAGFTLSKWISTAENPDPNTDNTGHWQGVSVIDASAATSFTFTGLDDGIYKLEETAVPAGYNKLADKIFTISATHSDTAITDLSATGDLVIDGNETTGILNTSVQNQKGTTLPSTGGIGTTIFYVVGGTLVAGAVVLLITKKRMSINDQK